MRKYIQDLITDLIGRGKYAVFADRIKDRDALRKHVCLDLEIDAVATMNAETLGRIMSMLEVGDVMSPHLGREVTFSGDCEQMLRNLVALALAYVIVDRLKPLPADLGACNPARLEAHLKIENKELEWVLLTATARHERCEDIGLQIDQLTTIYGRRKVTLARLKAASAK